MDIQRLSKIVRVILTAELFVGGQARLGAALSPRLYGRAMAKAEGTQKYLSFIPIQDPEKHTNFIGALMMTAGLLLSYGPTCLAGGLLSISSTLAGVYSQYRMDIPYWLPSMNTVLAAIIIYAETR